MTTQEKNEVIARWMGLPTSNKYGLQVQLPPDNPSQEGYWTRPKYHESWDWLMPVVEKIEYTSNIKISMYKNHTCIESHQLAFDEQFPGFKGSRIEATYNAVVFYIESGAPITQKNKLNSHKKYIPDH